MLNLVLCFKPLFGINKVLKVLSKFPVGLNFKSCNSTFTSDRLIISILIVISSPGVKILSLVVASVNNARQAAITSFNSSNLIFLQ